MPLPNRNEWEVIPQNNTKQIYVGYGSPSS